MVVCGFVSEYTLDEPQKVLSPRVYHHLLWKSASLRAFLFSDYPEEIPNHLNELMALQAKGELNVNIDPRLFKGLDQLTEAMDHLYKGKNTGRVLLYL